MVLLGTLTKVATSNGVCKGPVLSGLKIEAFNNLTREAIFFNLCKVCQLETMASIPPAAFSASRIRETQRNMTISKPNKGNESTKIFNNVFMELSPLKYISKLMNSIWGSYNRYSPHNVKKINDAHVLNAELQQPAANSNPKSEPIITLLHKVDSLWAAINMSPSH